MAACFDEQRALPNSHHHQSFHNNPVSPHLFRTAASLQLRNRTHIASRRALLGSVWRNIFVSSNSKVLASRDPWTLYEPADTLVPYCRNQYNDGLRYLVTANAHNGQLRLHIRPKQGWLRFLPQEGCKCSLVLNGYLSLTCATASVLLVFFASLLSTQLQSTIIFAQATDNEHSHRIVAY